MLLFFFVISDGMSDDDLSSSLSGVPAAADRPPPAARKRGKNIPLNQNQVYHITGFQNKVGEIGLSINDLSIAKVCSVLSICNLYTLGV